MLAEVNHLKVVAQDSRRIIREHNFQTGGAITHFKIVDGSAPLGQHYHKKKFEVFTFLSGGGAVHIAEVGKDGQIISDVRTIEIKEGMVIKIIPFTTHRFDLGNGTEFMCYSSERFDPEDMISCPINK